MWPPVHPAVGYLLYATLRRARGERPPADGPALAALLGGALPDLIDQPLYRIFDLPSGRILGHSLLFVLPLAGLALVWSRRRGRPSIGVAFAVGLLAHPTADALWPLLYRDVGELQFLFWPLAPSPPYESTKPIASVAGAVATTRWIEIGLLAAAIAVWLRDGAPGPRTPFGASDRR